MASQTNFLQSLGWAVLNSLWQLALLWVVYQLLTGIFKQAKPAGKSLLASSMLIAGFGWFVYTFIIAYFGDIYKEDSITTNLLTGTNGQLSDWLHKSLPIASIIYLSLLLLPVLRFIRNYRYVQIIRRYGLSKLNVEWRMFVNKTANRIGIKKPVQTWVSELVSSPVTIGFWKPVILVPLAAINHLTPQQLEAVLLHELSHIRRSDYLINLLLNFIQTILYFNPFVRAFVKIVEREREKSCDEMVLQFQYDSHDYATALLTLEKVNHVQKPLAIAAAGKKNDLLHRIETILGVQHKSTITFNKLAGLFTGLLCIIALNGLLIINKPVTTNNAVAFADFSAPVNMFTDENIVAEESTKEFPATNNSTPANTPPEKPISDENIEIPALFPEAKAIIAAVNPEIINASLELAEQIPHLNKMQEQQVKEAIAASRKVIEDVQWKKVEKDIADVFSRTEKEKLKATYEKELGKMNWTQWENKLRQAYDKVDWERVNEQLTNAVSMVRIDSLQSVYSAAISKLDIARSEMKANNLSGIPDTDVTLKDIEQKRKDLLQLNNYLKAIRSKKIVRL